MFVKIIGDNIDKTVECKEFDFDYISDGTYISFDRYLGEGARSIKLDTKNGVEIYVMNDSGATIDSFHLIDEPTAETTR